MEYEHLSQIETQQTKEIKKPAVLYHGSAHKQIEILEPRNRNIRDQAEGPRVFASPDKRVAAMFMADHRHSGFFDDVPYVVIEADRDEFIKNDPGGTIYNFSSDNFQTDPDKGLGEYEWVSKVPVKPQGKTDYPSVVDALLELGVQVYFADTDTINKIDTDPNHGRYILIKMESENQKRGINVKRIPSEYNAG
jgi:hypothetical protein